MKIKLKAIRFRSDQKLKNSIGLIKVKQLKKNFHSSKLSEVEIDILLKEYFSTHQMMQRRDFQSLCGMVRSTAMIHIRRICQEGKLQNIGLRNQPIYRPCSRIRTGHPEITPTLRCTFPARKGLKARKGWSFSGRVVRTPSVPSVVVGGRVGFGWAGTVRVGTG